MPICEFPWCLYLWLTQGWLIESSTVRENQLSSLNLHAGLGMGKPSIWPKYEAAVWSYTSAQRKGGGVLSQSLGVRGMANSKICLPSGVVVFVSSRCYSEKLSLSCANLENLASVVQQIRWVWSKSITWGYFPFLMCPCCSPLIHVVGWEGDSSSCGGRKDSQLVRNASALLIRHQVKPIWKALLEKAAWLSLG